MAGEAGQRAELDQLPGRSEPGQESAGDAAAVPVRDGWMEAEGMRVLVACEESQAVCAAFRERGHEAYSCDIQECSGGHQLDMDEFNVEA